jgi:hypothetical protein
MNFNPLNDADIEMAELEAAGRRSSALRKRGICDHGWLQVGEPTTCLHCGKSFPNADAAYEERREILS